jgi:DNA-binding response OmpR family regulator
LAQRVLVVEDDTDVRWMIADFLTQRGYQVETAIDGQQAISRLEGAAPDLVTLDLSMPIIDGSQVAERLRVHRGWERVPILMVSASHDAPDWARKLKGVTLLQKPFELKQLGAMVDELVPHPETQLPRR